MTIKTPVAAASASLNKTITEIMEFLEDDGDRPSADFRPFLREKIADLGEHWFKRGFRRGHIESQKHFRETGEVPDKLRYSGDREFFNGESRTVRTRSTLRLKISTKKPSPPPNAKTNRR